MKKIYLLLLAPLLSFAPLEVFLDFEYITIDGAVKQMNEFEGKRIMVIVLPVSQTENDLQLLKLLDSFSIKYSSKYTMIGIPSIEDGYSQEEAESLKTWYKSTLHNQFIITTGMYTKKASPEQDALFRWLTNKNENIHFDEEVEGPGEKYFINEQGELYGVYSPGAVLNDELLNAMSL